MNKLFKTSSLLCISLLVSTATLTLAQVNVIPIEGGYRFRPETKLLPTTRITPSGATSNNWSEPDYCTTPDLDTTEFKRLPWYGNPQYLEDLLDSVGYPDPCPTCRVETVGVRYRIPVVFWVYNNAAGTDNTPEDRQIQAALDHVNRDYRDNDTGFRFYLACNGIRRVNNDDWVETSDFETIGAPFERAAPNPNFVKGAINIHVVRNNQGLYNPFVDAIFVSRNRVTDPDRRSTLSHEIGHALGLLHTHQFAALRGGSFFSGAVLPPIRRRFVEPVDRARRQLRFIPPRNVRTCSVTGDALCDTPADPRLRENQNYQEAIRPAPNCVYDGNQRDPWNDEYANPPAGSLPPDPANIMSYGRSCRLTFTREQIAVMVHRVERGRYSPMGNGYRTPLVVFDDLEPNNNFEQARNIPLNTPDTYTFNRSYRRTGAPEFYQLGSNTYDACDVDWAWFRGGGFFRIETSDANQPGTDDANTELRLYETTGGTAILAGTLGTLLATDDNGGVGNFSRLERTLPFGNYAIEVVNRSPDVTGYYTLEVATCPSRPNPTVTGPTEVCGPTTYTVQGTNGLPVRWSVTGNLSISGGTTATSVTVTGNGSGGGQVTATVGAGACAVASSLNVTGGSGTPATPSGILGADQVDPSGKEEYTVSNPRSNLTYQWQISGGSIVSGQNQSTVVVDPNCPTNQMLVRVRAYNGCKYSGYASKSVDVLFCPNNFSVYPNPTNDFLTVALTLDSSQKTKNQALNSSLEEFAVQLYNPQNIMVAEADAENREVILNVRNQPLGVYVLHILYQGKVYPHEILIE